VLLIITGKSDGTVDALVNHLQKPFFRLNLDDFRKYEFTFSNDYWKITNPTGLTIDSRSASACFWWKAFMYQLDFDKYVKEEIKIFAESLYSWFVTREKNLGNPPYLEQAWGKFRQADIASKYLTVPAQYLGWGEQFLSQFQDDKKRVAKSISGNLTESSKALFTTEVEPSTLDPSYPWYLQEKVISDFDITIQIVGDQLFAFQKSRSDLSGIDWRKEQFSSTTPWNKIDLPQEESAAIKGFISEMGVTWGRMDFLREGGELKFLELNPNGQWVFLDPENKTGLLSSVAAYLQSRQQ
jgi:hypothetical protein